MKNMEQRYPSIIEGMINMNFIYGLPYCSKCVVAKNYMKANHIPFEDRNIEAEGKPDFLKYYAKNRKAIYRSPSGRIELPVFTDGEQIRQGAGPVVAYLHSGTKLDGFFDIGLLKGDWVDQIHVSGGNPEFAAEFLEVLRFLKSCNMQLQIDTNGKNSAILRQILEEGLADVMILNPLPEGAEVDASELEVSHQLIQQFPNHQINS